MNICEHVSLFGGTTPILQMGKTSLKKLYTLSKVVSWAKNQIIPLRALCLLECGIFYRYKIWPLSQFHMTYIYFQRFNLFI